MVMIKGRQIKWNSSVFYDNIAYILLLLIINYLDYLWFKYIFNLIKF